MAAGRGEFFRSFLEGLEKKPEQPAPARGQPGPGRGKPGPGAQQPGPGGGKTGDRRWQRRPKAAPSSVSSWPERGTEKNKAYFPKMNLMERLPSEILIKILSYLDASSLSCIGHVSKLFHHLANDENLNVSWELTVCDCWGRENTLVQSRAYFFESSVIVRWSGGSFPEYQYISNIQLHGVRKETLKSPGVRKPGWRSLILKLDMKCQRGRFLGKDRLIKLIHLSPGFIVGVWRGLSAVAFIMVSLHFHRLVEKSLLGSPVCPYSEPVDLPRVDNSDSEFGLHGYTLHFVLHNTGTEIMSGHFRQLSCCRVQIQRGLLELKVINRTNLSQHRSLSGNIKMPWKSEALEGSVESCCIITLTLLDEFQKPFWCVSSPIRAKNAKKKLTFDYSGEHFLMEYLSAEGQVKMKLVWLKEQKQFFLISLAVYIPVYKVNKHFSRKY
ncbi:F-box only protein 15-like isoform X2 [Dicentrarchus labrax]|uniref:F-box only protein 15-like isoform X2 n=1 Tax=Dicentrarchus labrax TaxID=13489 RepID=UPI0021F572A3|nr:F-box only protein 15-like isoform X2 [Dicentrarchus labrax]